MRRFARYAIALAGLVGFADPANARMRMQYEDWEVVERSELIVVGHLKRDSIQRVPHKKKPGEGQSWEHHATLAVTKVLKGKTKEKQLPIIIHYGLDPRSKRVDLFPNRPGAKKGRLNAVLSFLFSRPIVEIHDTGNSSWSPAPVIEDATDDNLWFLRRRSGLYGEKPGAGKFGIVDPEDVQSITLKDYVLAYLSDDPETAVRQYVKENPSIGDRAVRYLTHCEIQHILKIEDLNVRAEKLVAVLVRRFDLARMRPEREITACGTAAGPHLMRLLKNAKLARMRPLVVNLLGEIRYEPAAEFLLGVFDDPGFRGSRQFIIALWGKTRCQPSVAVLIDLIEKHDRFWARQKLAKGWWNDSASDPNLTRERRRVYVEVYQAVIALRTIGDPRAREAVELTLRRWKAINFENPQIVEECEKALSTFDKKEK